MENDLTSKLPLRENIKHIKRILKMVAALDKTYFFTACIVHIINVIVPYIELILSAYILDAMLAKKGFEHIFTVAAATTVFVFLLHFIASIVWNHLEVRKETTYQMYECVVEQKMLQMDYTWIDSPRVKDLKDKIRADMNWGAGLYSIFWQANGVLYTCFHLVFAIAIGASVFYYIWKSGNYMLGFILLCILVVFLAAQKLSNHYQRYVNQFMYYRETEDEKRKENIGATWDWATGDGFSYQNGKDIRLYRGYRLLWHWTIGKNHSRDNEKNLNFAAKSSGMSGFYGSFSKGILEAGSYFVVGILAFSHLLSIGNVVKMAACLRNIFMDVQGLINGISMLSISSRQAASTLDLLDLCDDMYKGKLPVEKRSDNEYTIEFRDVSFRYPQSKQYALRHFSITLNIGEKLAIVGMNGSGKTTMIKLLCRLYDPDEGEILLNGVNIKKFKHDEYSKLFAVVFQDYQLFSFSLGENVAVSNQYDRERVKKCLKAAGFGERFAKLERGTDTFLYKDYEDDGVEISGGEAQKIAIARAIYKDAPFVLLDEPTAALDPLSEYEIYTSFDKIVGSKTAIYISHRLASCRFCEKIAVFHEGRLVQSGTHQELLQDVQGKYYEMWNAQAQYYQEEA